METVGRIRREHLRGGKSIKALARELRMSRNTVRKVLRSGATDLSYERTRQPQPKIGPWREELEALLLANDGKPARERLTLIRLFETLRGAGYEGGYDAVRRYAKAWQRQRGATAARGDDGAGLRSAELRAGRGIPVRLVARGRADRRHDGDGEGGAGPALP